MEWRTTLVAGWVTALAWAGPVTFEPAAVDFGIAGPNLHLETEVKVTNATDRTLSILGVSSDCSCTAGELRQRTLAPGETSTMPVAFDTRQYQGAVQRRLTVRTSAGDAELPVRATIRLFENWEITPSPVIVPASVRRDASALEVTARYVGTASIKLVAATTDQPWLTAELKASPTGGSVVLRKLTPAPVGTHQVYLTLKTSDPTQPQLVVQVLVPVISAARVLPNPIVLPTVQAGSPTSIEVRVSGWEETTAPVARLASGQVQAQGQRANGDYVFHVTAIPTRGGLSTQMLQLGVDENSVLLEVPVILRAETKE
jgi:hypothetical protein